MKVKVITLFKDNLPLLKQYMRSFIEHTKYSCELVLVDNCSLVDTKKELFQLVPSKIVKLISLNFPVSFSIGNNMVAKTFEHETDIFCFCNNDILFEDNWLKKIVEYYKQDEANMKNIVGPVIKTNNLLYKGGLVTIQESKLSARWVNLNEEIKPNYIQGCCMAISSKMFHHINYFDIRYQYYFEDVDICWKLARLGGKLITLDNVIIEHLHAKSSHPQWKKQAMDKSKKYFIKKWGKTI